MAVFLERMRGLADTGQVSVTPLTTGHPGPLNEPEKAGKSRFFCVAQFIDDIAFPLVSTLNVSASSEIRKSVRWGDTENLDYAWLYISCNCLRWCFTLYRGKSPLNLHLREYVNMSFFSKHLEQIQACWNSYRIKLGKTNHLIRMPILS